MDSEVYTTGSRKIRIFCFNWVGEKKKQYFCGIEAKVAVGVFPLGFVGRSWRVQYCWVQYGRWKVEVGRLFGVLFYGKFGDLLGFVVEL